MSRKIRGQQEALDKLHMIYSGVQQPLIAEPFGTRSIEIIEPSLGTWEIKRIVRNFRQFFLSNGNMVVSL
jgi:hypothetical protein